MFLMTNHFDDGPVLVSADKLEALIRLDYDFTEWNETLEYAE